MASNRLSHQGTILLDIPGLNFNSPPPPYPDVHVAQAISAAARAPLPRIPGANVAARDSSHPAPMQEVQAVARDASQGWEADVGDVEHILASCTTITMEGRAVFVIDHQFNVANSDAPATAPPSPPAAMTQSDEQRSREFCVQRLGRISSNIARQAVEWTERRDVQAVWIRLTADSQHCASSDVAFLINTTVVTPHEIHPDVLKQENLFVAMIQPWLQDIVLNGRVGVDYPGDVVFKQSLADNTMSLDGINWTAHTYKQPGRRAPWLTALKERMAAHLGPPGSIVIFHRELDAQNRPSVTAPAGPGQTQLLYKGMAGEALDERTAAFLRRAAPIRAIVEAVMAWPATYGRIDIASVGLFHMPGHGSTVRVDLTDSSARLISDPPAPAHVNPNGLQEKVARLWADLCRQGTPEVDHPVMVAFMLGPKGAGSVSEVSVKLVWHEATMPAPRRAFVSRTYNARPGDDVTGWTSRSPNSIVSSSRTNTNIAPPSGSQPVSGPHASSGASNPLATSVANLSLSGHSSPTALSTISAMGSPPAVIMTSPAFASPPLGMASPPLGMASPPIGTTSPPLGTAYAPHNPASPPLSYGSPHLGMTNASAMTPHVPAWTGGTLPPFRYQGMGGLILDQITTSFLNRAKADIGAMLAYIIDWPPTMRQIELISIVLVHIRGRGVSARVRLTNLMGNDITTWTTQQYTNWGLLQQVVAERWATLCRRGVPGVNHPEMLALTATPRHTQTINVVSAAACWEYASEELESSVESIYAERAGIPVDAGWAPPPATAPMPPAPMRATTMPVPLANHPPPQAPVRAPTAPVPASAAVPALTPAPVPAVAPATATQALAPGTAQTLSAAATQARVPAAAPAATPAATITAAPAAAHATTPAPATAPVATAPPASAVPSAAVHAAIATPHSPATAASASLRGTDSEHAPAQSVTTSGTSPTGAAATGTLISPTVSFVGTPGEVMPERTRSLIQSHGQHLCNMMKEIMTWPPTLGRIDELHAYLVHMRGKGSTVHVRLFDTAGTDITASTSTGHQDATLLQNRVAGHWATLCREGQLEIAHPPMLILVAVPATGELKEVATRAIWVEAALPESARTAVQGYYEVRPGDNTDRRASGMRQGTVPIFI
ncbi:unnamed protein product [Cutaneotrichosporon oleaginosum]